MLRRFLLVFSALTGFAAAAADRAPIVFTLRFPEAAAHYVDVEAHIPTEGASSLTVFMSVWTPGSYLVREYARNIVDLTATAPDGPSLAVAKITKNRWEIATADHAAVTVHYRLYGREINVRGNWVEADFAMLNGAPTFISVVDDFQRPYVVNVVRPAPWQSTQSALVRSDTLDQFTAPDFDTLVDSPILVGSPQVDSFEVDGVPHTLVTLDGGGVWDNARAAQNLQLVITAQRDFWGHLPLDRPYTIFNLLTGDRGGLEHRNAFTISADRWLGRTHGGITSWLSLASHEYFHTWNGKRLRPVELGPFAYEHENYTPSLWIVEGITSYYQHVILARAGFYTPDRYLGAVSGSIAGTQRTPGRLVQAFAESSFDAWIKAYRSDENSVNTLFSYYGGAPSRPFSSMPKFRSSATATSPSTTSCAPPTPATAGCTATPRMNLSRWPAKSRAATSRPGLMRSSINRANSTTSPHSTGMVSSSNNPNHRLSRNPVRPRLSRRPIPPRAGSAPAPPTKTAA